MTSQNNEQFYLPLESVNLYTRERNHLMIANLQTISNMARVGGEGIPTTHSLGKKSADEIARALHALGIHKNQTY